MVFEHRIPLSSVRKTLIFKKNKTIALNEPSMRQYAENNSSDNANSITKINS